VTTVADSKHIDPIALTQDLIRCPSVTPEDAGVLAVLEAALTPLGFECIRLPFEEPGTAPVENLYARLGSDEPNFCFAGHVDVVPVGDLKAWSVDPFAAEIVNDQLYGRGAADMKGAIACFVAAVQRFIDKQGTSFGGSISLLITGDEEGPSINGTKKMIEWLRRRGEPLAACIVGEPTNPQHLGEMMKIGRRGSYNADLTVLGVQGHAAYPHLADNPIDKMVKMLSALTAEPVDAGNDHFPPSTLAITSVDVGNQTTNVISGTATAKFNIRFNSNFTGAGVEEWVKGRLDSVSEDYTLKGAISGESFLTPPGLLSDIISQAVSDRLGSKPKLSTTGGTSDARFIKDYCPVVEFGLVGQTMHKVDERVDVDDIHALTDIYHSVISAFFQEQAA